MMIFVTFLGTGESRPVSSYARYETGTHQNVRLLGSLMCPQLVFPSGVNGECTATCGILTDVDLLRGTRMYCVRAAVPS